MSEAVRGESLRRESAGADDETMKLGLLMEGAQAHQKLAELHLERLRTHTQDLDGVVREEIRRTLVDELSALTVESERAASALRRMQRVANLRGLLCNFGIAVVCTAVPSAVVGYLMPSPSELASLRTRRDALTEEVRQLERRGGKVQWRTCGEAARLCVRIDRKAPVFGADANYYVVLGY